MWNQKIFEKSYSSNPKYLVVLLHGYGSNARDLIELSDFFNESLPNSHFLAPNAIEHWEGGFPDAYQWFSLSNGFERKSLEEISSHIKSSNEILRHYINKKLEELNLKPKNLFLVGFSQGAMMAKYQALTNPEKIAGVVGFSGKLISPELTGDKIISQPTICMIHGREDMVVDFNHFLASQEALKSLTIEFEAHALDNLGHSINMEGVKIACDFLKKSAT
ncbi:MAG: dienelactone hydrolase family protein [Rickettsiales bacterium]|nr:dienelactone hydrolase family protein [Rickettsiales bacterium]